VTGTAWIGLEQNIIDTAVNEWRKHLLACVCIVGQHFKQFYCTQLKNGQLDEMSASVSESELKLSNHIAFDKKMIFRSLYFPKAVQKQTLG